MFNILFNSKFIFQEIPEAKNAQSSQQSEILDDLDGELNELESGEVCRDLALEEQNRAEKEAEELKERIKRNEVKSSNEVTIENLLENKIVSEKYIEENIKTVLDPYKVKELLEKIKETVYLADKLLRKNLISADYAKECKNDPLNDKYHKVLARIHKSPLIQHKFHKKPTNLT